jgi:adenine-specific DNA-methyltransferase
MPLSFKQHIENLFKNSQKFSDSDGNLDIPKILESIEKIDIELIKVLKDDEKSKKEFFTQIEDIYIFNQNKLIEFFSLNDYMKNGSYTAYTNKIGLIKKDNFIKKFDDVVLAFPHKDCVLEGGQTKDDDKKKEVFYNEILSSDEIDRLFEPKVLTNIKRYSKNGVEENCEIKYDDNLVIKGNNLIALHSLKKKFAGKVKLIYIDPPYNTGNDSFKYNDNFNHSTWLTFIKNRLEIARKFLSEDGVIFVQCDDNEQAYLKVLMDEVFDRENFIATLIWEKKSGRQNDAKFYSTNHEYILNYAKKSNTYKPNLLNRTDEMLKNYKNPDNDKRGLWTSITLQAKSGNEKNRYKIKFNNNVEWEAPIGTYARFSKEKLFALYEDNRLYFGEDGKNKPRLKKFLCDVKDGVISNTLLFASEVSNTQKSKTELQQLFGKNVFDTPKPEKFIEYIVNLSTNPNDLIMDYHLGSGTTCAVAHKMGRKYIGIEQMDYIEDVAVERLKKVIDGEQGGISKAVNWQGGGDFVYAELKTIDTFKDAEIGALNKNMQYLPISEIEDETYNISKEEIAINKAFYGIENE